VRGYFFTGLAVLAPLFITCWMLIKIFSYLDSKSRGFVTRLFDLVFIGRSASTLEPGDVTPESFIPYGASVLLTLCFIVLVGMVARSFIVGRIIHFFENLLLRVPVASRIYSAAKQIVGAFIGSDKTVFENVVMIEYPKNDCYCLGFLTSPDKVQFASQREMPGLLCVFIPTTPNPTSGFLLLLPEEKVRILGISVEDGLKMIISGGVVLPPAVSCIGSSLKVRPEIKEEEAT